MSILLIEDNEDDWEATKRSFRKNNFLNPIKWCSSSQEALQYLRREGAYANDNTAQTPDLILLDLNMPGMDGRQLLEVLKTDDVFKKIPVIILTTSSDERDIEDCYALGASTYVQKPVTFDGLTEALKTLQEYWFGVALLPRNTD